MVKIFTARSVKSGWLSGGPVGEAFVKLIDTIEIDDQLSGI